MHAVRDSSLRRWVDSLSIRYSAATSMQTDHDSAQSPTSTISRLGLPAAPIVALLVWVALGGSELEPTGRIVAAIATLMAVLWLTEALPIAATALLPLALVPLLTGGAIGIREVASPYAHEMIFLFMGGFMIALAMQRCGLHRRIALHIIQIVGVSPRRVILGFMLAAGLLSMWISNTATTVMMLPIALSVIELIRRRLDELESPGSENEPDEDPSRARQAPTGFSFAICLLLGIAYGASIGGTATLIGTPPNAFMAGFMRDNYGREIAFADWLPFGLPFALVLMPLVWLLLVRVVYPVRLEAIPGGRALIREELRLCGKPTASERAVGAVFLVTASLWLLRGRLSDLSVGDLQPFAGISDAGIAMLAAAVLFAWPVDRQRGEFLLDWKTALGIPWGILLLFGGGLSLASCVASSGVDRFIGGQIAAVSFLPEIALIVLVTAAVILLTEMTSNAATTATFLPIVAAAAQAMEVDPLKFVIPATLAASCAFMMPVATPPNAIVFGSGEITIPQMVRAGIWVNVVALVLIVVLVLTLGGPLLGIE